MEVTGNKSLLLKLKNKINELAKKGRKDASGEAEEEEGEGDGKESAADALKKKKSLIIKIVIGAAVIALILHESPEEEAPSEPARPTESPAQRAKKEAAAKAEASQDPAEKKPETAEAKTEGESATTETAAAETPPAVTPPVEDPTTETPPAEAPASETPTETAKAEAPEEPVVEEPVTTEPTVTETPVEEPTPTETAATDPVIPSEEIQLDLDPVTTPGSETSVDSVDGTVTQSGGDDNLTDKILQDLEKEAKKSEVKSEKKEYVAPPDYEYTGRGLVYNCTGKHWACVDGPSYRICEENSASNKTLKKPVECYPFNVYQSQKGCENVQNRMVSSSAKTAFCNE